MAPIGDRAVLRRGNIYPNCADSREHDTVGKHEQHSHTRNARLDAREMFPLANSRTSLCRHGHHAETI